MASLFFENGDVETASIINSWVASTPNKNELGDLAELDSVNNSNWVGSELAIENGGTGSDNAQDAFDTIKQIASQGVAESGSNNELMMTALRVAEAIAAQAITIEGADVKSAGSLTLNDAVELYLGTDQDIEIFSNGSNGFMDLATTVTDFRIRNVDSAVFIFERSTGDFTATGDITGTSDERLKENIEVIDKALDRVLKIKGITYTDKGTTNKRTGVVAQDVLEVLPEAVKTDKDGYHSVAYGKLIGLLVEAIKEQQLKIRNLESEVESIKQFIGM